jgi:polysaccharide biosynthesis protein PelA
MQLERPLTVPAMPNRRIQVWVLLALALFALMPAALALEVEFAARPVRREILALYDSLQEKKPAETRLHRLAEMPLNWLGWKLVFVDINGRLPVGGELQRFRGAISWFLEPIADPLRYLGWLDVATASGLKLVCLAEMAPPEPPAADKVIERIFARLGLKPVDQFVNVTHKAKVTIQNPQMAGFERPIDKALPAFRVLEAAAATTQVHLSASVPGEERETTSALIATSPAGGYVAAEFTIYFDPATEKSRWIVNPFLFFKTALGDERMPVPDVTTLSGRRMYFSHIDGDGWNNISEIEGYREMQLPAADVIRREAIEPFPDLPVSIGLIAGDAVPALGGSDAARQSAKRLFALPQVEVASHTYSHPFAWGFFENYDRNAELLLIDKAAHPALSLMDKVRAILYRAAGKPEISEVHERYVAGSADLPRSYLKDPFDLEKEVNRALEVSSELAPAGKKAAIYLWSGDTEAFEAAIHQTRAAGVRNMNGGDSRFDNEFPSALYVPPIARPVGAERQIYAANSNENTYTNNWHGPYYGQLLLEETFKNTETPRRLKPANLYYHMYSGEKASSLAAIKHLLGLARTSPVIPVKASDYAAIADDFFATDIAQIDASKWSISSRGAVQTMRFDDAAALDVDYAKSAGVLGLNRHQGSIYVALDPAVEPALIALKPSGAEPSSIATGDAHLVESRWRLSAKKPEACGFRLTAEGYGPGEMVWEAAPGQVFDIRVSRSGRDISSSLATAGTNGRLTVAIPANAIEPLELRFQCHER